MAIKAVIHDFQPDCLRGDWMQHSVLTLPAGRDYVIRPLIELLARMDCRDVWILPGFDPSPVYEERLGELAGDIRLNIVGLDERAGPFLGDDDTPVLLIDPRHWPRSGWDFAPLLADDVGRGQARFALHRDPSDPAAESIVVDPSGNLRAVRRHLAQSAPASGVCVSACLVSSKVAQDCLAFPLSKARRRAVDSGACIQDIPAPTTCFDLKRDDDLLAFICEYGLGDRPAGVKVAADDRGFNGGFVDPRACVADDVRIVGPVVIHADAMIADGVTLIGPAVIGRGAAVARGAVVAGSAVLDGYMVPPETAIHNTLFAGSTDCVRQPESPATTHEPADEPENAYQIVAEAGRINPTDGPSARVRLVKRAIDLAAASIGLVVLSPLMVLVAIIIKLTSAGPVFFVHRREGKDGREFGCLKFRTMMTGADALQKQLAAQNEADGRQFLIRNDPRVTLIGRILRKTNIDELPQLLNVLVGQMSLVGPRPSPFRENQVCAPWRRARLSVRPGITGLWQICRRDRDAGDFHQWIHYDISYVRNLSIKLDLKILWYTIVTLGGQRSVAQEKLISTGRDTNAPAARSATTPTAGRSASRVAAHG